MALKPLANSTFVVVDAGRSRCIRNALDSEHQSIDFIEIYVAPVRNAGSDDRRDLRLGD